MLTPNEIGKVNEALQRFKAQIDLAKKEAGFGISDWLFDAFYFGGHPRQDIRAAATGERLYNLLKEKARETIESTETMHEEALDIVLIANRAAKWDRANAIESFRRATDVPGAIGDAAKKVVEETGKGLKFIPILIVMVALLYVYQFLPKPRGRRA